MHSFDRLTTAAFLVLLLTAGSVAAQEAVREIPRDRAVALAPFLEYALGPAGTLQHEQFTGRVRRVDGAGKEVASAKVPAGGDIARGTTLVLSGDRSNVLVIHRADNFKFQAKHRVLLLDVETLKTRWEFPLGECSDSLLAERFPMVTDRLTLLCYHSRPPHGGKRKPTLALVTVDMNRGEVVRWSELGGERQGTWVGPMFFGWRSDTRPVAVEHRRACGPNEEVASEASQRILVLNRDTETGKGDVWAWNNDTDEMPERIATLSGHPRSAVVCTSEEGVRELRVTVDLRTSKAIERDRVPRALDLRVETVILPQGR